MLLRQHGVVKHKFLTKSIVIIIIILDICDAGAQKESIVLHEITFQLVWVEGKVRV